jgi:hypothetical protein
MAHFAKVNNGIVQNVIVAEQEFIDSYDDGMPGIWIQTSYNTKGGIHYDPVTGEPSADQSKALRYNYASIGGEYDSERDAFIPPRPHFYPSWSLNQETLMWEAPIAKPNDGLNYGWNEDGQKWELISDPINRT